MHSVPIVFFIFGGFVVLAMVITFLLTGGVFGFIAFKGIQEWSYNNSQTILSKPARVMAKRIKVTGNDSSSSTWYYATFEFENNERAEFQIGGPEYGLITEGDAGELT